MQPQKFFHLYSEGCKSFVPQMICTMQYDVGAVISDIKYITLQISLMHGFTGQ